MPHQILVGVPNGSSREAPLEIFLPSGAERIYECVVPGGSTDGKVTLQSSGTWRTKTVSRAGTERLSGTWLVAWLAEPAVGVQVQITIY